MPEAINGGEAADLRERMRTMEARQHEFESGMRERFSVHEAKCASRYLMIMFGVAISIAMNMPAAWPSLMHAIGLLK